MTDANRERQQGDIPSDSEDLVGDAPTSDRLSNKKVVQPSETKSREEQNPPHTTTGKITSPKFGSAGSGGAEFEPGPERD